MTSARILIVEDEQITAADIEDILTHQGHQVVGVVVSGEAAVESARIKRPDLILMDIRIKGKIDGCEAASQIRERFGAPAVFLTAHADDATIERAKIANPLGYVVKPFHASELQAAIQVALRQASVEREREERVEDLAATLESLGEGVLRTDELGAVRFLNPAASRWTGWTAEDAKGAQLADVFRLLERETAKGLDGFLHAAIHERAAVAIPAGTVLRSRDGVERPVSGTIAPVRDSSNHKHGVVIAFGARRPELEDQTAAPVAPAARKAPGVNSAGIIVGSTAMRDLMRFANRIASSGVTTILLQGESGVGKDVVARFLHQNSKRREEPFIALNCAAIPETLLESEIFGYEKGAFTDAHSQKKGVLDLADRGTVFLDEIGELQPHIQAKLLRVLEDQSFRRLGGVKDIEVDLRIITATNRDLAQAVRDKQFREDLYYRLNVIQIWIPPIRDRKDDVMPLVEHFIKRYNRKFEQSIQGVSAEAEKMLLEHEWPGNVREIRNVIERAMVLEDEDTIQPRTIALGGAALTRSAAASHHAPKVGEASLEEMERAMLLEALEKSGGNQTRAAKLLGITRDTLRYRIKKFGLR